MDLGPANQASTPELFIPARSLPAGQTAVVALTVRGVRDIVLMRVMRFCCCQLHAS